MDPGILTFLNRSPPRTHSAHSLCTHTFYQLIISALPSNFTNFYIFIFWVNVAGSERSPRIFNAQPHKKLYVSITSVILGLAKAGEKLWAEEAEEGKCSAQEQCREWSREPVFGYCSADCCSDMQAILNDVWWGGVLYSPVLKHFVPYDLCF